MFHVVFITLFVVCLLLKQIALAFLVLLMLALNAFYILLKTQSEILNDIARRNETIRESNRMREQKKRRETTQMPMTDVVSRIGK